VRTKPTSKPPRVNSESETLDACVGFLENFVTCATMLPCMHSPVWCPALDLAEWPVGSTNDTPKPSFRGSVRYHRYVSALGS
jgi:hypothetical protein